MRQCVIEVNEREGRTVVEVHASEPVRFSLDFRPIVQTDPRVADLQAVVENQRGEIAKHREAAAAAKAALVDAKEALKAARRPARRRR